MAPCDDLIRPVQQHPHYQQIEKGTDTSIYPVQSATQANNDLVAGGEEEWRIVVAVEETLMYSAIQYITLLYNTVQYSILPYCTIY
jgi:hypothetical protein